MPAYVIRNTETDSVIDFAATQEGAEHIAAQVRDGRYDNNPRDCYVEAY